MDLFCSESDRSFKMTDESSTTSTHLSVAMTTTDVTQVAGGLTSLTSRGKEFYFQCIVLVLGIVGTAANALIIYALVASKQHKKHALIVNQNVLDLYSCVLITITYAVKMCNIQLTGMLGYLLCSLIISECLMWTGIIGSVINLGGITVERYIRVVHPVWSKNKLRNWMLYSAIVFSWVASLVYNITLVLLTSIVVNGICYAYAIWSSTTIRVIYFIWNFLSFYVVILLILVFCYWRILIVIRRQASVMAGHSAAKSSAAQAHSNQIQTNVIKTMIIVSIFYAIAWIPTEVYFFLMNVNPHLPSLVGLYYAAEFIACLYTCSNPFIYATKFHPVKQVLLRMIPCIKISDQATGNATGTSSRSGHGRTTHLART